MRNCSVISGYMARTDYVNHIQLELITVNITARYTGLIRLQLSVLSHISIMANHILNVTCSIGDLGCISFILWGFEDREFVYTVVEMLLGSRMHNQFDGLISFTFELGILGVVFDVFINKCDVIVEIILIRYNVVRLFNCIILDVQFAIGATYSGVMLLSTGFNLDIRLDCTIYTRCSITTCVGGISSCSIVRLLLRL